jgi:hypothetical protein
MISTGAGPLWLSAIRDAFYRRAVARETSARADADLVLTKLEYALAGREVEPGQLVPHADHGCQYTSVKLTTRLPGNDRTNKPEPPSTRPGQLIGTSRTSREAHTATWPKIDSTALPAVGVPRNARRD